jgi:hypothetical protein
MRYKKVIICFFLFIVFCSLNRSEDDCTVMNCVFKKSKTKVNFPDNVYILIDPGHGGSASPVGSENKDYDNTPSHSATQDLERIIEQEYVTVIAQGVRTLLNSSGFNNVELTRATNIDQTKEEKATFIYNYFKDKKNEYDAVCQSSPKCCDPFVPIFLSIHTQGGRVSVDTTGDSLGTGTESMYKYLPWPKEGYPDFFNMLPEVVRQNLTKIIGASNVNPAPYQRDDLCIFNNTGISHLKFPIDHDLLEANRDGA